MAIHDHMERLLSRNLRAIAGPERLELAAQVVKELGGKFDADACSILAEHLEQVDPALLDPWIHSLPATASGEWLRTQLLPGGPALAAAWERFCSFDQRQDPLHLIAWARALAATGENAEASAKVRLALRPGAPQTVFARSEKLIRQLAATAQSSVRQARIAVLGSSTTNLFVPILRALCLRDRIAAEIYEAPFGSIAQEILDPASGLAAFKPNIVLLVQHWRDLHLGAVTAGEDVWIEQFIAGRMAEWKRLTDAFSCHVVQPAADYPAHEPYGHLSGVLAGGRTRVIELLNLRLRQTAPANVSILDSAAVQREAGACWEDEQAWTRYRQHPSAEALPALAEAYMAHVRAVLGLTRKVLVTDLDNTLWHGVIGEDGLEGIGVGPGKPESEAHQALQQYLLELKSRGILLAVSSKNNAADAQQPFLKHPHMILKLEDFAAFKANWEDKASNIRAIAKDLSLGLDSFVFLDDNPLEREWVRSSIPEVEVVELGKSAIHFKRELDRGRYFEALSLSNEDLARADQYRVEAQRESLRAGSDSLDDFLRKLKLEASVTGVTEKNLRRVTQLANKTNQFNVTTRRYTEAQIHALAEEPRGWAGAFEMSDRMGSYGLIGVLICRPIEDGATWEIDTWLMSCRTLGRQMEKFMFDRMIGAAIAKGVGRIKGVFRPTPKNALVKDLFSQMGFRHTGETPEELNYELAVPAAAAVTATHVRDVSR